MIYKGLQSIYTAALGEYRDKGFRLVAHDDHVAVLFYQDEKVGVFSQTGMTIQSLHEVCKEYLEREGK